MLSPEKARRLKPLLDGFVEARPWAERLAADPLEFPRRYEDPRDIEVAGLISASLAYGRADLFKPKIAGLLERLGPHPARAVEGLSLDEAAEWLAGFVYRFNVASDLAVLLLGMGGLLRHHGSLEGAFLLGPLDDWQGALAAFARRVREAAPGAGIRRRLGTPRGLHHLLPSAEAGAAKRLNLYLRWMVRGPDGIDLGVWRRVRPAQLVMPVDTHVMRIARWLGLTSRKTIGWATAEEITASLRRLDPDDPVRYDFALCHYGMSGACPLVPVAPNCARCPLRPACRVGRRLSPSG